MSGLAAVLAGHEEPGIHLWHGAFDPADVRHTVEHAGWGFGYVDGWTRADSRSAFLAAVGETLDFPDHYGQNFDALADCLHDIGSHVDGVVLLWDGWATLARSDERAFSIALSVLGSTPTAACRSRCCCAAGARWCRASRASTEPADRLRRCAGWPRRRAR